MWCEMHCFMCCVVFCLFYWNCKECVIYWNLLFLFILLQQEAETVKTETDVGVPNEGDTVSMDPYRFYIPSSFSIQKYEPEVSHVFRWFLRWFLSSVCVDWWRDVIIHCFLMNIFYVIFHRLPLNACTLQLGHSWHQYSEEFAFISWIWLLCLPEHNSNI